MAHSPRDMMVKTTEDEQVALVMAEGVAGVRRLYVALNILRAQFDTMQQTMATALQRERDIRGDLERDKHELEWRICDLEDEALTLKEKLKARRKRRLGKNSKTVAKGKHK